MFNLRTCGSLINHHSVFSLEGTNAKNPCCKDEMIFLVKLIMLPINLKIFCISFQLQLEQITTQNLWLKMHKCIILQFCRLEV